MVSEKGENSESYQLGEVCPIVEALMSIRSIWRLIVIRFLLDGAKGFNELLRTFPAMNAKTLSRTLKSLQEEGLVDRKIVSTSPFLVKYELTQKGRELRPTLTALRKWGSKWITPRKQAIDKANK
ncbi:MAG: helix-turn-helix domain-containing protein [Candidatus Caldarchaeum sp.]|jgi:DNA-binding HxlR family transcriptional regulator